MNKEFKGTKVMKAVYNFSTGKTAWIDIVDENKTNIAQVNGAHYGVPNRVMGRNAKLFTAAPKLLDACIKAEKHHQGGHSEIGIQLREAINKALN